MTSARPFAHAIERLRSAGLRPTRQRLALVRLLFDHGDRHVSAEALHAEAQRAGVRVSLATIYNTLNQFTEAGLLREVVVEAGRSYFDTNTGDHHHFFFEGPRRPPALQCAGSTSSSASRRTTRNRNSSSLRL
jgi:Fur family iron response transcriptional regulator